MSEREIASEVLEVDKALPLGGPEILERAGYDPQTGVPRVESGKNRGAARAGRTGIARPKPQAMRFAKKFMKAR